MPLDRIRKILLATTLFLGIYLLVVVPIYSVFVNPQVCQLSPFSCVNGVKFTGGEALYVAPVSLLVFPLLIIKVGRWGMLLLFLWSAIIGATTSFNYALGALLGMVSFARTPRCYIFGGNCLDHNLFHISQIPFVFVMMFYSYKAYKSSGKTSPPSFAGR